MVKVKVEEDIKGEGFRFLYNFNMKKDKKDTITDGTFGVEVDDLKMGFYAPLVCVINKDNTDMYLTIDDSYDEFLPIPVGNTIHMNLSSIRENLGVNADSKEFNKIISSVKTPLLTYLKDHKNDFEYLSSKEQTFVSGPIGRLSITLTNQNIEDLRNLFKENLDEAYYTRYKIDRIFNNLKDKYSGGSLNIDIYKGNISKISLIGKENLIEIEISNINNEVKVNLPKEGEFVELENYLTDGFEEILGSFGFNIKSKTNKVDYLQEQFADFATFMIACVDYVDKENFEYADICIEKMDKIVANLKTKVFNDDDKTMTEETYASYVEFFEELVNYCTLYKEDAEDPNVDMIDSINESVLKLNEISKNLDLDLSSLLDKDE